MGTPRHPGKVLHGLGFVSDEADVACNLLQDIKRHSKYCVTKAVDNRGRHSTSRWHSPRMDMVCGLDEEVREREGRVFSPEASAMVSWINAVRDTKTTFSKDGVAFQPFQNLLVMDFMFYLIQKICPTELDDIIHLCKRSLSLHHVTTEEIRAMKERFSIKHSVYIIPRRHGKTSMVTALMAATVLFIENIVIGYGCHRKGPLEEAFFATTKAVRNIRERFVELARLKVKTRAGKTIRAYNKQSASSILFISLQNDKVTFGVFSFSKSYTREDYKTQREMLCNVNLSWMHSARLQLCIHL